MGLHGIAMEDVLIQPLRVHQIALPFHLVGVILPHGEDLVAGEGFGAHHGLAEQVPDGTRQLHAVADRLFPWPTQNSPMGTSRRAPHCNSSNGPPL